MQQIYMCVKVMIIMIDLFSAGNSHPSQEEEGRDAADLTEDEEGPEINCILSCQIKKKNQWNVLCLFRKPGDGSSLLNKFVKILVVKYMYTHICVRRM